MARILHISDAHLGKPAPWQQLTDDKAGIVGRGGTTTQTVLQDTLKALQRSDDGKRVEAVIFSGDITNYGREDGYKALEALAGLLPTAGDNSKTLIVPGNHDVVWDAAEGSTDRYRNWVKYVRHKGFVTPLLDGIDFDDAGALKADDGFRNCVLEGDGFVAVALNSSNFCGVVEGASGLDWERLLRYKVRDRQATRDAIKRLRQHDVARISQNQIRALEYHFEDEFPELLDPGSDPRVRIAVLHHHLLPVSSREEVKTFESIVNLGEVRMFLRDHGFHVVLHGHKHDPATYFDFQSDPQAPLAPAQHRTVVISAPGLFAHGELTCRVLDVSARATHARGSRDTPESAPSLDIRDAPGLRAGEPFRTGPVQSVDLWRSEMEMTTSPLVAIYGDSTEQVYERLQARFADRAGQEVPNVLCVVQSPTKSDEGRILPGYPPVAEADEEAWFKSLVDWWQLPTSHVLGRSRATAFNHGERLYGEDWNASGVTAVQRAADALNQDPETTRSLMILVDPRTEAGHLDAQYPAFVLAQLRLVSDGAGHRLDCVGYFRKQDVRHWWPVNVAELTRIQTRAQDRLRKLGRDVTRGQVVTFAAIALIDERLPSLDVARIDRAVDQEDEDRTLWRMAYAVFHPKDASSSQLAVTWDDLLADLVPRDVAATERKVATVGLSELRGQLERLQAVVPVSSDADEVVQLVRSIETAYRSVDEISKPELKTRLYEQIDADLARLRDRVARILGTRSGDPDAQGAATPPST